MFPANYPISAVYGSGALVTYGTLNLTESSPAQSFTEPFTVAEAKTFLNLPARLEVDEEEDALIEAMIVAARESAEIIQGRDLVQKQYDLSLDYWRDYRVELRPHLASVDLVRYKDSNGATTDLVENTDFIVDTSKHPGILTPAYNHTWPAFTPWPSSAILIRFTAGLTSSHSFWSDAGARVRMGMRYLIAHWFENRNAFERGAGRDVTEFPYTVTQLLQMGAIRRAK